MVARIVKGKDIIGLIKYNEKAKSSMLYSQYINDAKDMAALTRQDKIEAFQAYIQLNPAISKPTFHVSLNPDPRDILDDEQLQAIGRAYMAGMHYGEQPYLIYKHEDIARVHLHIVSVNIGLNGKAINSSKERYRSETVRKQLEIQFQLHPAGDQEKVTLAVMPSLALSAAAYGQAGTRKAIAQVVCTLAHDFVFPSLSAFRTLLHHYQVTVEEVKEGSGENKTLGLLYAIINAAGEKVSPRIKASQISAAVCYPALLEKFAQGWQAEEGKKLAAAIRAIAVSVLPALPAVSGQELKSRLAQAGLEVVYQEGDSHQLMNLAFIHTQTKTVWDAPTLGLNLPAPFSALGAA